MESELTRKAALAVQLVRDRWEGWLERSTLPPFANRPKDFTMRLPRTISGSRHMTIGDGVKLGANSVLKCNTRFPGAWMRHPAGQHVEQSFTPQLMIGDRVTATAALQVVAYREIVIEDEVMFAANVYLSDGTHGHGSGERPYMYQGIAEPAPIRVGRGSWIGQNAVIMPGVAIGRHCIVGANSVVTSDLPDGSVAVGAPARVVKRWNGASARWERVEHGELTGRT